MHLFRDVAQWIKRGALPLSLPTVRFQTPLGTGFSDKYHVTAFPMLGYRLDVVFMDKTRYHHMLHLTPV